MKHSPQRHKEHEGKLRESSCSSCLSGEQGFTLLEVLVALTILSLSIGVLFAIFAQGLARTRAAEQEMAARTLAQSLLAQADAYATPYGERSGNAPDGMTWDLKLVPYRQNNDDTAAAHAAVVTATVTWQGEAGERSVMLTTMQMHPREQSQ